MGTCAHWSMPDNLSTCQELAVAPAVTYWLPPGNSQHCMTAPQDAAAAPEMWALWGRRSSSLRLMIDRAEFALQEAEASAKTPRVSSKRPAQVTVVEGAYLLGVTSPPAEGMSFHQ